MVSKQKSRNDSKTKYELTYMFAFIYLFVGEFEDTVAAHRTPTILHW